MMIEKLKLDIAGEITLSPNPGKTMRKWREIFGITQAELAGHLNIVPSTICDYESNRRSSPGTHIIKRFVNALIEIDAARGGTVIQRLSQSIENEEEFFTLHEFATSITGLDFAKLIKADVVTGEDILEYKKVYGYTLIKSLKVILNLPPSQFLRLFGAMSERAFIFTEVSTGRSPMVVIRVSTMKPSIVVLHKLNEVDELALKIAKKEQIPVMTTSMSIPKIKEVLGRI